MRALAQAAIWIPAMPLEHRKGLLEHRTLRDTLVEQHDAVHKKGIMKLLLTSGGISNTSIHNALVERLRKPIAESAALCIPTAAYAHPMAVLTRHGGSSADKNPPTPCANWAGSPWECWS